MSKQLVNITTYAEGKGRNYGLNCLRVEIGCLELFFSYQTCVAFHGSTDGLILCENWWGPTTGKHLNWISRTAPRLPRPEFDARLNAELDKHKLILPGVNV